MKIKVDQISPYFSIFFKISPVLGLDVPWELGK